MHGPKITNKATFLQHLPSAHDVVYTTFEDLRTSLYVFTSNVKVCVRKNFWVNGSAVIVTPTEA